MKNLILILILSIILAGCQTVQWNQDDKALQNWDYGDLRLIDPVDAVAPDQDLIALYTRINDKSFQIRIDFLDMNSEPGQDIYILIDTNPGGIAQITMADNGISAVDINWDYLIKIPASGNVGIVDDHFVPVYGLALLIVRNTTQDNMVIRLNKNVLPISLGKTKLQVIITPPNQKEVTDKSDPFSIDAPSPARAKVIFAFWNTFSSATPAQTLRSWAGAHAGPMSSRHGLKYLLDAADHTKSTVFLLDLLNPVTLSALDYLNVLPQIRKMANQGILALPVTGNVSEIATIGEITNILAVFNANNNLNLQKIWNLTDNMKDFNRYGEDNFIIFLNKFIYLNSINLNFGVNDYAQIFSYRDQCSLLYYITENNTLHSDFFDECKSLFVSYALANLSTPLVLGGDFSNSILGDPAVIMEILNYIKSHPWIQILSINDLKAAFYVETVSPLPHYESRPSLGANPQHSANTNETKPASTQLIVYEALLQSPKNKITDLAWQVFSSLSQPSSPELLSLRSNYLGQIGLLLTAAQWVEHPANIETCILDLDYDGQNECILANKNIFVIIEPEGGYIPFVFAMDVNGIHQIIGPTWEFIVGLSDPSTWDPTIGLRGDSSQILGAFSDQYNIWNNYNADILSSNVIMVNESMSMRKSVSISQSSLHIDISDINKSMSTPYIPLVIDPWLRYTSGWGDLYTNDKSSNAFLWGINSGEMVAIHSTNQIYRFTFNATRADLAFPEDPNFDYSRGHYLPFPMALTEINSDENYSVDIIINP